MHVMMAHRFSGVVGAAADVVVAKATCFGMVGVETQPHKQQLGQQGVTLRVAGEDEGG